MSPALDAWIIAADTMLRTVSGGAQARRPSPARDLVNDPALSPEAQRLSGALMRVDHVGEVCAQALYEAQALGARDPAQRDHLRQAAQEETDHLAWTARRLEELGAHRSWLNPLWYAGAFALGSLAAKAGDRWSLGFVIETERQVGAHLADHLNRLPEHDVASRAVVTQMKDDEARHAEAAAKAGGRPLPWPVRQAMRAAAKVMTTTAHYL
ncbi:2-polyprenyl-3-methyl-6-methoxy-1,4-benzoquinone monooxygenase [Ideonella sp. B7]|uniref:2-polyprenyl-3-methyl-6-methoxy-1,4-benzoquinone monooxygenase n=1 Tax=Ideonella benzenivorans TaxID=2831643 RepID=UPI001CEDE8FC|nr:2-polyprenyl-3-methyl-6-methoxy-1,4-benzoquinone monooxygenase [Ideonella benzenivorans]MCA6218706.1 2-polyprenyl-3-methyl-6-methoxy-1,4-benzoquinone monooxygenase [Ideonella benzenivorans]